MFDAGIDIASNLKEGKEFKSTLKKIGKKAIVGIAEDALVKLKHQEGEGVGRRRRKRSKKVGRANKVCEKGSKKVEKTNKAGKKAALKSKKKPIKGNKPKSFTNLSAPGLLF